MPWSKFSPREPPLDPLRATSESGARRVWVLRWGTRISQGMLYLGIVLILYWGFMRGTAIERWFQDLFH